MRPLPDATIEFWSFEAVGFETPATGESLFNLQRASLHWRSRHALRFVRSRKAPGWQGRSQFQGQSLRRRPWLAPGSGPGGARDRDRPGLHGLELAHEVDVQEPVRQARALDHDMVGELETTLEGALGDALVEYLAARLFVIGLLLAADRQRVFLRFDRQVGIGEAGDCDRDGRRSRRSARYCRGIAWNRAFRAAKLVEQGEHPVEADG